MQASDLLLDQHTIPKHIVARSRPKGVNVPYRVYRHQAQELCRSRQALIYSRRSKPVQDHVFEIFDSATSVS